jgi:pyrimidine-nucleoside phosphorylase
MKSLDEAQKLGSLLKEVGELHGLKVTVCFTDMNQPLGNTAGLWCEVQESVECLRGNGPDDVMQVVYHLGQEALNMAGVKNPEEQLKTAIADGSALKKFREMVDAHGGSLDSLDDPNLHKPEYSKKVYAETDGYITSMDTVSLGMAVVHMGGGRIQQTDNMDYSVGITYYKKTGDKVFKEEPLLAYYCSGKDKFETGKLYFHDVIQIQTQKPKLSKLIVK